LDAEAVILIGLQGAGKSTFYQELGQIGLPSILRPSRVPP
jgi:hypothetical protein